MCTPVRPVPASALPRLEVADIFRDHSASYRETHALSGQQDRVMRAIEACRSAQLGGHIEVCDTCGVVTPRYHSCGNRHCPKCQTLAKERWVEARTAELLPTEYFHIVFTLPHDLNPLAQGNPRIVYDLLFKAAAETLQAFGRDPRWLGGELGITMVLHTWGQNLGQHVHVHCVVTGGALAPDGERWIPAKKGFLFPVRALSRVFRGKYLDFLSQAHERGELRFAGSVASLTSRPAFAAFQASLSSRDWVVYAKQPLAGPEQVLAYLGRYTHRVAISNDRLISVENGEIRFRWRDYRRGNRVRPMRLTAEEFIRRFLLHVLPPHFMRLRHFGVLANRCRREKLSNCRRVLGQPPPEPKATETASELMHRVAGIDIHQCSHCHEGRLIVIATLAPVCTLPSNHYPTGPPP